MQSFHANSASNSLSRALQLREAVVLLFCDPLRMEYVRLLHLSRREWTDLLRWLDTSGLALYFLDRLKELDLLELLPPAVLAQLRKNLADNTERINEMIAESASIQRRFQEARLSYAVLKGFSLWPISVPKLELRSQLDLDFLVADESVNEARRILEDAGYRLDAQDAKNLDFKANEGRAGSLKDLYKAGMTRSAELHMEHLFAGRPSLLSRTQELSFHGVCMPVLPPVDLFLGQALHLFKHVCLPFWRAAHMIEFRRHVIARRDDVTFWNDLRKHVAGHPQTCIRLGILILLVTRVMGPFAPEALTSWTVDRVPATAKLWVDLYAHRSVLAAFPGSKLYLLLEKELEGAGMAPKRASWLVLVPRRLPPFILHAVAGETLIARMNRYWRQLHFIVFRLRFHLLEGMRYFCESILWRQYRNELSQ
jgi:hypothetical protein